MAGGLIKACQCISDKTFADIKGSLAKSAKWKVKVPFDITLQDYLKMQCENKIDAGLKLIVPKIKQADDVLIYHSCGANVYTASKRDCLEVLTPAQATVKKFLSFYDNVFEKEIVPLLEKFDYSYDAWYNLLDQKQQTRQDNDVDHTYLEKRVYCNFCKKEKQIIDDDSKNPKNRCICGPNEEYKYVMGPITHMLEHIFKHNFKGYSSGKNWTDHEKDMNAYRERDLRLLVQGDGSSFDRTQDILLKEVEFKVYRWLADHGKITHVDKDIFITQATMPTVKVMVQNRDKFGNIEDLGFFLKTGCTQTGNMDTTFANTLRMDMYIRYIIEAVVGLEKDQYDLKTQGDDFAAALPTSTDTKLIENAFLTVFSKDKTGCFGLGQILKFLCFTDLSGLDFCSTEAYYEPDQGYKLVRKLDRFLTLTCWSQKALSLSSQEQYFYMMQLYESNTKWIGDLPIYKEYNDLIYHFAQKLNVGRTLKQKQGKPKKFRDISPHYVKLYASMKDEEFDINTRILGKDEAYSLKARISEKHGSHAGFLNMLSERYGLSTTQVRAIQAELIQAKNLKVTDLIDLSDLSRMMEVKNSKTLCSRNPIEFSLD